MLCSWCRAQTDQRRARRVEAFPAPCLPRRRGPSQSAKRRARDSPCATWPHAQILLDGSIRISLEENAHRVRQFEQIKINTIYSPETVRRRIVRPSITVAPPEYLGRTRKD